MTPPPPSCIPPSIIMHHHHPPPSCITIIVHHPSFFLKALPGSQVPHGNPEMPIKYVGPWGEYKMGDWHHPPPKWGAPEPAPPKTVLPIPEWPSSRPVTGPSRIVVFRRPQPPPHPPPQGLRRQAEALAPTQAQQAEALAPTQPKAPPPKPTPIQPSGQPKIPEVHYDTFLIPNKKYLDALETPDLTLPDLYAAPLKKPSNVVSAQAQAWEQMRQEGKEELREEQRREHAARQALKAQNPRRNKRSHHQSDHDKHRGHPKKEKKHRDKRERTEEKTVPSRTPPVSPRTQWEQLEPRTSPFSPRTPWSQLERHTTPLPEPPAYSRAR